MEGSHQPENIEHRLCCGPGRPAVRFRGLAGGRSQPGAIIAKYK